MGYKALPADATACPKCGGVWGYQASDMALDIRVADWTDRDEETSEIKITRCAKSAICMNCGYRFLRP